MRNQRKRRYLKIHAALYSIVTIIFMASLTVTTIKTLSSKTKARKDYAVSRECDTGSQADNTAYYLEALKDN